MTSFLKSLLVAFFSSIYFVLTISYLFSANYNEFSIYVMLVYFVYSFLFVEIYNKIERFKTITETKLILILGVTFMLLTWISLYTLLTYFNITANLYDFTFNFLIISIIPILIMLWYLEVKLFNINYKSIVIYDSKETSNSTIPTSSVTINSDTVKKELELDLNNLIAIEAQDNYCMIYFLEEGSLKKELFRATLNLMDKNISHNPQIFRVHRSYIVNKHFVKNVLGKSQNYKLTMQHLEFKIPVSRNFDITTISN